MQQEDGTYQSTTVLCALAGDLAGALVQIGHGRPSPGKGHP